MNPGWRTNRYRTLMPHRVRDILMVASAYDSFVLEEDGRFSDRLLSQYMGLDLASPPHFHHVTTARDALTALEQRQYDLVLMTPHASDMSPVQLARALKTHYGDTPVVMMTYEQSDAETYATRIGSEFDHVFLWLGDPKLLVTLVKAVEDQKNVANDTREGSVRVILVVEDAPLFYSAFLPEIYTEVLKQVHSLLPERLNERDRYYRMQARPKILLARNHEQAQAIVAGYANNLLGVITDLRFPDRGKVRPNAGLRLIRELRAQLPDLPILLQSRDYRVERRVHALGAHFVNKTSPDLLREIRDFMKRYFGFGPFIIRNPDGTQIDRAHDLTDLIRALEHAPAESLKYHADGNHFSNWLMARSEFALAKEIRPLQVDQFQDVEAFRDFMLQRLSSYLENRQRGRITDARDETPILDRDFTRIGSGSIGGKARGIAYVSHALAMHEIHESYPDLRIYVPRTAVFATDFFDRFVEQHGLLRLLENERNDRRALMSVMEHPLDGTMMEYLAKIIEESEYPLAVRSSSLHEDSQLHPLAGLYKTFLIPNHGPFERRLEMLSKAVRHVYASTFFNNARTYLAVNALRLEQEKMAVIVQRLVGHQHDTLFYPDFSGVAQSHNYYPMGYIEPKDGIATVALGFGATVVEGGKALRFCPRYPEVLPQMSSPEDALAASQREFFAVDMARRARSRPETYLNRFDLDVAESQGTLEAVGATYSHENHRIYDSIHRQGVRIVNFAGVLKYDRFPLAPLLRDLLEVFEDGMGSAVEMEFAVTMNQGQKRGSLAVLQLRPLVTSGQEREIDLSQYADERSVVQGEALGNGIMSNLRDVVYLVNDQVDFSSSRQYAAEIGRLNHKLLKENRHFVLIGPGRWGTADPWLGVPVNWTQVSAARIIVEVQTSRRIDPSQGTHFFHNLTALRVGYFSVHPKRKHHHVDWAWLAEQNCIHESGPIRHVRLQQPLTACIDGRRSRGLIFRDHEPDIT